MLNAILSGKKVGSGLAGLSLHDSFDGSEDLLTSSFLERLFYFKKYSYILFNYRFLELALDCLNL